MRAWRNFLCEMAPGSVDRDFVGISAEIEILQLLEPWGDCLAQPTMDFDGDCKVSMSDFVAFTQHWLEAGPHLEVGFYWNLADDWRA